MKKKVSMGLLLVINFCAWAQMKEAWLDQPINDRNPFAQQCPVVVQKGQRRGRIVSASKQWEIHGIDRQQWIRRGLND